MQRFPDRNVNYERFPPEYFSGSNIRIYFGDIFIDEIILLTFGLQEQLLPLYGYNSFSFDKMLRGSRIVQGSFSINFKDTNYISTAIDSILTKNDLNYNDREDDPKEPNEQNINKLYDFIEEGWTKDFKKYAQDFKKVYWENEDRFIYKRTRPTYFNHDDRSFDILISYGDDGQSESRHPIEKKYRENINRGTVKSIKNVYITQVNQTIELSGQPIAEEYSFIAKDLDRK